MKVPLMDPLITVAQLSPQQNILIGSPINPPSWFEMTFENPVIPFQPNCPTHHGWNQSPNPLTKCIKHWRSPSQEKVCEIHSSHKSGPKVPCNSTLDLPSKMAMNKEMVDWLRIVIAQKTNTGKANHFCYKVSIVEIFSNTAVHIKKWIFGGTLSYQISLHGPSCWLVVVISP